jgi:hypothetical protein
MIQWDYETVETIYELTAKWPTSWWLERDAVGERAWGEMMRANGWPAERLVGFPL